MARWREEVLRQEEIGTWFLLRGKVAVFLILYLSDLSIFSPISDSRLLLLRLIRIHATINLFILVPFVILMVLMHTKKKIKLHLDA